MKSLVLSRQFAVEDGTIGMLTIDGVFQCFTIEDVIRDKKIAAVTAIPAGEYPVILCESPKFSDKYEANGWGRIVPLIDKVEGFSGIRIHVGNKATHSEGCVLVGSTWKDRSKAFIHDSAIAFKALVKKLAADGTTHRITIKNEVGKTDDKLKLPSKPLYDGLYGPWLKPPPQEAWRGVPYR